MGGKRLLFRVHALERMFQRCISAEDVRQVPTTGRMIEAYPDDQPYASRLVLGWRESRPIHVVVADNDAQPETIVITAYEPDLTLWEPGFENRKRR